MSIILTLSLYLTYYNILSCSKIEILKNNLRANKDNVVEFKFDNYSIHHNDIATTLKGYHYLYVFFLWLNK